MRIRLAPVVASTTAALIALFGLHYCIAPMSYVATKRACAREGGLRIHHTAYVDGYWQAPMDMYFTPTIEERDECDACASVVARRDFEYVEFGPRSDRVGTPSKYLRFELAPVGSEMCLRSNRFETPPAGMCVAAMPHADVPTSRFYVRENIRMVNEMRVELRRWERSIYDRETKRVAATFNYFDAGTPAERDGNFAWSYKCGESSLHPLSTNLFRLRILKDAGSNTTR